MGGRGGASATSARDSIYRTLGIEPEAVDGELRSMLSERNALSDQITALRSELEGETIPSDDPEIKALGRTLASMFDTYTDRGEEIRQKIGEKRNKLDSLESDIQKRRSAHEARDLADYQKERVVWNENRPKLVEKTQSNYKGFSLDTKTGSIQDALKRGNAVIVEMSPKEYLQRISYDVFGSSLKRGVRGVSMDNVKKYAKQMRSGTKFDMPWIDTKNRGQEGRHRAMAAILNGYQKIPVAVRVR